MSQAGILNIGNLPPPPQVPTSFITDNGTAAPALNIINIKGDITNQTSNGYVFSGSGNTITLNDLEGTGTTTGPQTVNLIVLNLGATPGVYTFVARVSLYDTTDSTGGSFQIITGAITDGTTARILGATATPPNGPVINAVLDNGLGTDQVTVIAVGNQVLIQGNGTVALKVIHWKASLNWTFVS